MKPISWLSLLLIPVFILAGCTPVSPSVQPTQETQPSSSINSSATNIDVPTSTPILLVTKTPSSTATQTSPATLEPESAKNTIRKLLQEPVDCEAPCFWGIVPGQTTYDEAKNAFSQLELQTWEIERDKQYYYGAIYKSDNGLSIMPSLAIRNNIIENINISITPEIYKVGVPREWLAYSPETLISRYGAPSRVDFFVGRANPKMSYAMILYFQKVNMIVEYGGYDIKAVSSNTFRICPLLDQVETVGIWLGKDPENPPGNAVPLEEATSLTLDRFTQLMLGSSDKACIDLNGELFP